MSRNAKLAALIASGYCWPAGTGYLASVALSQEPPAGPPEPSQSTCRAPPGPRVTLGRRGHQGPRGHLGRLVASTASPATRPGSSS